jgi:GT2 family glycosyltransferase
VSATQQPRLGIVVVNYGSHELIERNLSRVDPRAVPASVLVVDNFSSLSERVAVRQLTAERGWRLLERADNAGFGRANNEGAATLLAQGCTAVLFLNPDVEIETDVLRELLAASTSDPDALISPVIHRPDGSEWFAGAAVSLRDGSTRTRPGTGLSQHDGWLTGACLTLSHSLWQRVGGFDDDYFLYWEDVDLSRRCVDAGGRLVVRSDLTVVHDVGATQPGARKSSRYLYYNCRNRLLFAAKHLDRRHQLRWLAATPRITWRVMARDGRRAVLRSPGRNLAAVRGSMAGALRVLPALGRSRAGRTLRGFEG